MTAAVVLAIAACTGTRPAEPSIDVQRREGWAAGAAPGSLAGPEPCGSAATPGLAADLAVHGRWAAAARPALLESVDAAPPDGQNPLSTQIHALCFPEAAHAEARGRALAELLAGRRDVAIVVDLPGPESVGLAAGLAPVFQPVWVFDGWPHPNGVVADHLTLGALVEARDRLVAAERDDGAPPLFVLDSWRATPLPPAGSLFDNRYRAELPSVEALRAAGITTALIVRARGIDADLDDVHAALASWEAGGVSVRRVAMQSFQADHVPDAAEVRYYYGGSPGTNWWFWRDYGLGDPPMAAVAPHDRPPVWPAVAPSDPSEVGRVVWDGRAWTAAR